MPDWALRGGFRYMTLVVEGSAASVRITSVSLEISFQPTWSNLRAYGGYFHSSDDLLNKIWYSCAYTLQLNAIHPTTGRTWPSPEKGWYNDGFLGQGHTINTDGAKRDRAVWPGDMGVAIPASAYSTGDVELASFVHDTNARTFCSQYIGVSAIHYVRFMTTRCVRIYPEIQTRARCDISYFVGSTKWRISVLRPPDRSPW